MSSCPGRQESVNLYDNMEGCGQECPRHGPGRSGRHPSRHPGGPHSAAGPGGSRLADGATSNASQPRLSARSDFRVIMSGAEGRAITCRLIVLFSKCLQITLETASSAVGLSGGARPAVEPRRDTENKKYSSADEWPARRGICCVCRNHFSACASSCDRVSAVARLLADRFSIKAPQRAGRPLLRLAATKGKLG